ncbi:hypothetical protein IAT38_006776 [Cryptococcus sp. DSM 104549]
MGVHAVIPAAIQNSHFQVPPRTQPFYDPHQPTASTVASASNLYQHYPTYQPKQQTQGEGSRLTIKDLRTESYGSTSDADGSNGVNGGASPKGKEPAVVEEGRLYDDDDDLESEAGLQPVVDVTWKYMSRLYLLVPIITLVWLALLILLVTYAWPPSRKEREAGQQYPHPLLPKPLLIGVFASCTVQTLRVPTYVVVSWLCFSPTATMFLSRTLHTIIHELLRMSTLPLIVPSPTSGFHSSYYLGLGWGLAEAAWGIVNGWEQLALYQEVMRPADDAGLRLPSDEEEIQAALGDATPEERAKMEPAAAATAKREGLLSAVVERDEEGYDSVDDEREAELTEEEEEEEDQLDEAELERKVEILERMRERRELEEVIGLPYPCIPFPLHLLWRLDTLLLNLGLTLLLSAFYFSPQPIYRHSSPFSDDLAAAHSPPAESPDSEPSRWLWLVWALVVVVHVAVSLVWKVVGKVGIGAVTWGGLIVALGSVFAGLGSWGGLV